MQSRSKSLFLATLCLGNCQSNVGGISSSKTEFPTATFVDTLEFFNFILWIPQELAMSASDENLHAYMKASPFRFDSQTPNIRDKVVWDPLSNAWKLLVRKLRACDWKQYLYVSNSTHLISNLLLGASNSPSSGGRVPKSADAPMFLSMVLMFNLYMMFVPCDVEGVKLTLEWGLPLTWNLLGAVFGQVEHRP